MTSLGNTYFTVKETCEADLRFTQMACFGSPFDGATNKYSLVVKAASISAYCKNYNYAYPGDVTLPAKK